MDTDNEEIETIRTEDGILKKFTLNIQGKEVECMTIFPSNYILVKLDQSRDNLEDDTLYFLTGLSSLDYGHQLKDYDHHLFSGKLQIARRL